MKRETCPCEDYTYQWTDTEFELEPFLQEARKAIVISDHVHYPESWKHMRQLPPRPIPQNMLVRVPEMFKGFGVSTSFFSSTISFINSLF